MNMESNAMAVVATYCTTRATVHALGLSCYQRYASLLHVTTRRVSQGLQTLVLPNILGGSGCPLFFFSPCRG